MLRVLRHSTPAPYLMPTTRLGKRKRAARGGRRRVGYRQRKLGKPSRGITQSRYMFRRTTSEVIELDSSPGGGFAVSDNGVYKHLTFSLGDAGLNASNLQGTFRRYRINAVSMKMFFSNTQSAPVMENNVGAGTYALEYPNSQLLVYTVPNRTGNATAPTEISILNTQAKKVRTALNGGRPLKLYMKLNQLSEVYASATNTDYTTVRPQFISTGEPNAPHYGFTIFMKRADGVNFTSGFKNRQMVNIQYTYYLEFAGAE